MYNNEKTDVLSVRNPVDFEEFGEKSFQDMKILHYYKIKSTKVNKIFQPEPFDPKRF